MSTPIKTATNPAGQFVSLIFLSDEEMFELMVFDHKGGKSLCEYRSEKLKELLNMFDLLASFEYVKVSA